MGKKSRASKAKVNARATSTDLDVAADLAFFADLAVSTVSDNFTTAHSGLVISTNVATNLTAARTLSTTSRIPDLVRGFILPITRVIDATISADLDALPDCVPLLSTNTGVIPTEFHPFPRCPPEIRAKIWSWAQLHHPYPTTIPLVKVSKNGKVTLRCSVPTSALQHVNRESRGEVMRTFDDHTLISSSRIEPFLFNYESETFRIPVQQLTNGVLFNKIHVERKDVAGALKGDFSGTIKEINMVKKAIIDGRGHLQEETMRNLLACVQQFPILELLTIEITPRANINRYARIYKDIVRKRRHGRTQEKSFDHFTKEAGYEVPDVDLITPSGEVTRLPKQYDDFTPEEDPSFDEGFGVHDGTWFGSYDRYDAAYDRFCVRNGIPEWVEEYDAR